MDLWIIVVLVVSPSVLYFVGDALLMRFSPKYAAKRRLKLKAKAERQYETYLARQDRQKARVLRWAEAHPDDPHAKVLLAQEASAEPESEPEPESVDFLAEIRRSQEADDEYKQRRAAEKAAKELRAQQTLDWAIDNPTMPEARRHLEEKLDEATERLVYAEQTIGNCQAMMGFMKDETDPERINQVTRLSEAEATKAAESELVRRIQVALQVPLPQASEQ